MGISQHDISLSSEERRKTPCPQFQQQLEDRLNELKADLAERPFRWLAIAFIEGVLSQTLPVRILFQVLLRLVYWLAGPAILLLGIIKISDMFSGAPSNAPTIKVS
jgi:hypothetical protein